MTVESATYIDTLNSAYPDPTDNKAEGDNHLRLIKAVLKATFPNLTGAVTMTQAQLNAVANLPTTLSAPATTRMAFQQTAAPAGWTKVTDAAYNDAALKFTTGTVGTGGADVFSTVFGADKTTAGHSITQAQLPNVTFTGNAAAVGDHGHGLSSGVPMGPAQNFSEPAGTWSYGGSTVIYATENAGAHGHTVSVSSGGSGTAHTHGLTLNLKYAECIIATKD